MKNLSMAKTYIRYVIFYARFYNTWFKIKMNNSLRFDMLI